MGNIKVNNIIKENLELYLQCAGNIKDKSNNLYTFINNGAAFGTDRFGKNNNALYLNGSSYLIADSYKGIIGTDAISISLWFKTSDIGDNCIISWGANDLYQMMLMRIENGIIYLRYNTINAYGGVSLNDGEWHHLVYIKPLNSNNTYIKVYIDNVELTLSYTNNNQINIGNTYNVNIGRYWLEGNESFFSGYLDDILIFNKELTETEIEALYKNLNSNNSIQIRGLFANNTKYFNEIQNWNTGASVNSFTIGPVHNEGINAYFGGVLAPNGKVILIPYASSYIGIYDPILNTYTRGPAHGEGVDAFKGGVLAPNGKIIMAPAYSNYIGIYDPIKNTYTRGPAHGEITDSFNGTILSQNNKVVFVPKASNNIGIYNYATNTYTSGPAHGQGSVAYRGACLANNKVILGSLNSNNIGIYDPYLNTYTEGPIHGKGSSSFFGTVLAPNNKVIIIPYNSSNIGIYDPYLNTYTDGPLHGKGSNAFIGGVLTKTGKVILIPSYSDNIGIYDPYLNTYTDGPLHGQSNTAFVGGILAPNGKVILIPYVSSNICIYDPDNNVIDSYYLMSPNQNKL